MAKKKKTKYVKTYLEAWKCKECEFEWAYRTVKCPICSSMKTIKTI